MLKATRRLLLFTFFILHLATLVIAQSIPPFFNLSAGFYTTDQTLTISHPRAGATIFYTLDGSVPDENALVYTGAITLRNRTSDEEVISLIPTNNIGPNHPYRENWRPPQSPIFKGTVVRAIAIDAGGWRSPVNTSTYYINPEGRDRYSLPVISISVDEDHFFSNDTGIYVHGSGGGTPNYSQRGEDWERPIHIEYFETDGRRAFSHGAGARIHGGTSRNRPIKSLRLYARAEYGQSWFEYAFFPDKPVTRYKRILLRNSGNDWSESMLRDVFMQSLLVSTTELDIQYAQPAIIFINGEFWGIKNIRDRFDERYLQAHYGISTEQATFLEPVGDEYFAVARDNPEGRDHFAELYSKFSTVSTFMNNANIAEIGEMMDIDNFMDYQAAQIYFRNTDWPGNNKLFWRYNFSDVDSVRRGAMPRTANVRDGRWRWMVFDTDFGFGLNFDYVRNSGTNFGQRNHGGNDAFHNTVAFALESSLTDWPNPRRSTFMLRALLLNNNFRRSFANRYADLLNSAFKAEHVTARLDSIAAVYRPHMEEHIRRWNEPRSMAVWEQELNRIRTFGQQRDTALRTHLRNELNLGSIHPVTISTSNANDGWVRVNSLTINESLAGTDPGAAYPWTGYYFSDAPIELEALPLSGSSFVRWETQGSVELADPENMVISVRPGQISSINAVFSTGVSVEPLDGNLPSSFHLHPNVPNPFNPGTTLRYDLPSAMQVQLDVYAVTGQRVARLVNSAQTAGTHVVYFDASGLSSGLYIVTLRGNDVSTTRSITLIR